MKNGTNLLYDPGCMKKDTLFGGGFGEAGAAAWAFVRNPNSAAIFTLKEGR